MDHDKPQNPYTGYYGTKPEKHHRGCSVPLFFAVILSLCILGVFYVRWLETKSVAQPEDGIETPTSAYNSELIASAQEPQIAEHSVIGILGGTVPEHVQRYYGLPAGVYVQEILQNNTGLQIGDVITALNGTAVSSTEELAAARDQFAAGAEVTLRIWRDGTMLEVTLTLQEQHNKKVPD